MIVTLHRLRYITSHCFLPTILLLILLVGSASAQTSHATDGTTPLGLTPGSPSGSYALNGFDNINLFNGNSNITLPMLHVGGRGGAQMTMMLALNTKHWHMEAYTLDGSTYYHAQPNWWATLNPGYGPGVLLGRSTGDGTHRCRRNVSPYDYYNIYLRTLTRLTFIAPDGTEYELRDQSTSGQPLSWVACNNNFVGASRGRVFTSADGTSMTFISDAAIYDSTDPGLDMGGVFGASGYLLMHDGTRYRLDGGLVTWIRDRNGNKLSFTYDIGGRVATIKDSLNRVVTVTYDVSDGTYGGLYDKITFNGYQGTQRVIHIAKTALGNALRNTQAGDITSAQTGTQLFGAFGYSGVYNPTVPSAVYLPDNDGVTRKYQILYNPYAEVSRIVLPTGGAFEYDMTAGSGVIGSEPWEIYRRVAERRTYADGSTLQNRETFNATYNASTDAQPWYTTVTVDYLNSSGTLLARQKHYYNGSAAASLIADQQLPHYYYPLWSDGQEYQTEALNTDGTTVLRRTNTTFAERADVSWWTSGTPHEPANDPRITQVDTTLVDTNQVSRKTFSYDPNVAYNNQTDVYEYDFGSGAPGALIRRQHTDYLTTNSVNGIAYDTVNPNITSPDLSATIYLRGLPVQQQVFDAGGTERARASFEYDNYASDTNHASLFDRSSISGLDSAFTTSNTKRGNATATTSYLLVNGSVTGSITAYGQFDIAGNVVKAIDGRGYATNFYFTDCFGTPNGEARTNSAPYELSSQSQTSYAFVTSASNTFSQTAYSQYDFYTGHPVDGEDPNGIVASGDYNDALDRPTQVTRAANQSTSVRSQTSFAYDDVNRMITTTSDLNSYNDGALVGKVLYDGLGRTTEARQYEGGSNYIAAQTQYDSMGRAYRASNPFRPWQSESAVWTTSAFDALGRATSVTTPDSAVASSSYSGNIVTVTDQAGKSRKSVSDALGRLTTVYEDPSGVNYSTSYVYDVLGDLTTVSQGSQTRTFAYDSLKRLTSATNPESGTVSLTYDNNGNLTSKTDARSITTTYSYDAINRAATRSYSDGTPTVTYTYDSTSVANSKGRLTSVSSSVSTTNYTAYDALGKITSSNQVTDGQTYSMSYGYNLAGGQTAMTYPSGRVITSEYDGAGRLSGVRDQSSGVYYAGAASTDATNRLQYAAHGAVSVMKLGNGLWEHTSFNSRLQTTQIGLGTSSTDSSTMGLSYNYGTTNNNGNLQSVSYSGGGLSYTQSFGYDALNRLTTSNENSGSSWSQTNGYDQYGNRWIDYGGGIHNLSFSTTTNRITTSGYTYDSAGNLTNDSIHSYGFDAENKIKTVDGVSGVYGYDGDGNRVRKNFALGEQVRMVYSGGQLLAEYDLSTGALKKEYVYGAKGLIATIEPSTGTRYATADNLGSPRVVTSSSGSVVSRHDYMPFGEEIGVTVGGRTSGMGYSVVDGERQKFTQKERDIETGLDYFGARYYGSTQGRFTSPDPLLSSGTVFDPQSWNRYSYTSNNPLKYTDPTGLYDFSNELGGSASDQDLLDKANAIQDEKKRKKAVGQANHTIGLRNQFRSALAGAAAAAQSGSLTASQQAAVTRAVNAYGTEGDGNNVIVGFGRQGTGVGASTEGTSMSDEIFVNFSANHHGKDLIIDVAHEGSHVADNQAFNATHSGGVYDYGGPTDISEYETERRAYEVSSFVAQAVGKGSYPNNLEDRPKLQVWNSGWKAADRETKRAAGIDRLISTYYDGASKTKPGLTFGQIKMNVP